MKNALVVTLESYLSGGVLTSPLVITQGDDETLADFFDRVKREINYFTQLHRPD